MKAKLILEDGTVYEGISFGYEKSCEGEVVFNTGMVGYPENLTDPSYKNQILTLTYPLIGNYGVPSNEKQNNLPKFFESDKIHVQGLIIAEYSNAYSHWNAKKSLAEWLKEEKIPALTGIDTRALTKKLREHGVMQGKIIITGEPSTQLKHPVAAVSTSQVITYGKGKRRILLIDCGVKYNIIRSFLKRDCTVIRVPWDYDYKNETYDALFISNGQGDPKDCKITIEHLKQSLTESKPIFGICLGNQLLALAAGADTYKLKYGHRSQNQPCIKDKSCIITAQNHGYAVTDLPDDWEELYKNANDQTNEGIKHKTKPFFSVQFHPEASAGPTDTDYLFDEFIEKI